MSHTESTGNAEKEINLSYLKEFTQCYLWTLAREASGREKIEFISHRAESTGKSDE